MRNYAKTAKHGMNKLKSMQKNALKTIRIKNKSPMGAGGLLVGEDYRSRSGHTWTLSQSRQRKCIVSSRLPENRAYTFRPNEDKIH